MGSACGLLRYFEFENEVTFQMSTTPVPHCWAVTVYEPGLEGGYTGVPVSVVVPLPGPPLRDSRSVLTHLSVLSKYG